MRHAALITAALAALAAPAAAQQALDDPGERTWSALAGLGNDFGWIGVQIERYFVGDRLSAFVGFGYTPDVEIETPSWLTIAGGLRAFTGGDNHRALVEFSVTQVLVAERVSFGPERIEGESESGYGPGVAAGYQYVADGGFTFMASGGVGYAIGIEDLDERWAPVLNLGLGYTWR